MRRRCALWIASLNVAQLGLIPCAELMEWLSTGSDTLQQVRARYHPIAALHGQEADPARPLAALEQQTRLAIRIAEKSVVAIARVPHHEDSAGFQVPNLNRLSRLEADAPTDADYVPADFGAGIVVDRQGLIVTAYHVLGNVRESDYVVWFRRQPYRAKVVAADGWFDLAVLKVEGGQWEPMTLTVDTPVEKGQFAMALGNPQAMARDGSVCAAAGMIGNLLRRAPRTPERANEAQGRETLHHYGTLLQIDARLDSGYHGGALVNLEGQLIGLITAYSGHPSDAKGASFAIPIDEPFRLALEKLKTGAVPEFGFLGVGPRPLELKLRQAGRPGVLVDSVQPGSPALRAGLRIGDIITNVDGHALFDDDDLIRRISSWPPERKVTLTVLRHEPRQPTETLTIDVSLSKRAVNPLRSSRGTAPTKAWRGLRIDYATAAPSESLTAAPIPDESCCYVEEVERDSPAWLAGFRRGDFIVRVQDQKVTNPAEFFTATASITGDAALSVLVPNGKAVLRTIIAPTSDNP